MPGRQLRQRKLPLPPPPPNSTPRRHLVGGYIITTEVVKRFARAYAPWAKLKYVSTKNFLASLCSTVLWRTSMSRWKVLKRKEILLTQIRSGYLSRNRYGWMDGWGCLFLDCSKRDIRSKRRLYERKRLLGRISVSLVTRWLLVLRHREGWFSMTRTCRTSSPTALNRTNSATITRRKMQQDKRATNITFFDLKSNLPKQSPWCWRIRLVLNYKNLKYKTQFVEGANIRTVSLQNEFEPTAINSDGSPRYTLPALIDETDTSKPAVRISDSERIVLYLERTYPDANKPLFPSPFPPHNPNPALYLLLKQYTASALMPYINPLIVEEMISKMDKKAMEKVKERLKVKNGTDDVGSFSVRDSEKEDTWNKLEEGFGLIDSLLKMGEEMRRFPVDGLKDSGIENSDDRFEFFMGGQITYADLFMCGTLIMIQTASPEIVWGRIKTWNGGRWEKFLASMGPYMIVCGE